MRILMTCQPAFSHATQLIPLASELKRRGHLVVVATSATFAPRLAEYGLDARAFGPDWLIRPGDETFDRTVGKHTFFGFPQVPDNSAIEDLLRLAREVRPQLLVREYSEFAGWAAARRLGVPLVTQGIIHRLPPPAEGRLVELVGQLASLAHVEPPETAHDLLGVAHLDVVPPSFRCPWEHNAPLARQSRPSLFDGAAGDRPPPALEALGRTRPLVYVTLGTIFTAFTAVWRAVLTALSGLDVDAIMTTGAADPADLAVSPANVRIERSIPQSLLLPRCAAVVCHAGFNTMIGAFSHGLPVVCLPLAADQPVNAARCAEAGAGINAANAPAIDPRGPLVNPDTLNPDDIAKTIRRLLDEPEFTWAAVRLASEIQAMPSPSDTAGLLEQLVAASS